MQPAAPLGAKHQGGRIRLHVELESPGVSHNGVEDVMVAATAIDPEDPRSLTGFEDTVLDPDSVPDPTTLTLIRHDGPNHLGL